MILPQGLELKLSLCEGQLTQVSILYFTDGKKYMELCFLYISMGEDVHILFPISKIKDADLR